jgi:septal ring factor EnvC (AmiA/AmiB activator)
MKERTRALLALSAFAWITGSGTPARAEPAGATATPGDPALALAALDRQIADADADRQSSRKQLEQLGEQVKQRRASVVARGRAFYRLTRTGLLPIGGGFGALVTHAMHVERARRVLVQDVQEEARLRAKAAELARHLEKLAHDQADLAAQRATLESARAANEDEQRRQAEFDKAFQTSTGAASGYVPVLGGGSALSPDTPAGGFATARGRLLFPVVGRADVSPARREGAEGPGLEIHAPAGSPVRAVFAGRVAFADRYGPYGKIVILDHGDHYFTVSGNLDEIDVKIGQDVAAGDRLGTVGDDGHGSMLYFEVRHGSRTVQPKEWLGL